MSWRAAALTSFLVTLARPASWVVGLAGFLVRGGLIVFLIPIIALPTPVGLANLLAPTLTPFVFGGVSPFFVALIAALALVAFGWLVGGGWIAAATERSLIVAVAMDDDVVAESGVRPATAGAPPGAADRILAVRLVALVPLAAALVWGAARVVDVTYVELTAPSDAVTPVGLRILRSVPDAVAAIVGTWVLAEIVGALAARRVVLDRAGVPRALGTAIAHIVRRPLSTALSFAIPSLAIVLVTIPAAIAAGVVWEGLRIALVGARSGDEIVVAGSLVLFIAVWVAGLAATGVVVAWRHAMWTLEALRVRSPAESAVLPDAIGWNSAGRSGTL